MPKSTSTDTLIMLLPSEVSKPKAALKIRVKI